MSRYTTLLSKSGMKSLKKDITALEQLHKKTLAELRGLDKGETHERRLERIERLDRLEIIEGELRDKQFILEHAKLYPRKRDALKVALGSVVELLDTKGRIVRYTLVDSIEANPSEGRISANSPLGQSLLGKTIKDTVEWSNRLHSSRMQLVAIR